MKSVIAVPFARKLSGRTNYRVRLALIKSGLPRLVARKTLGSIILQVVEFGQKGDRVLVSVSSRRLKKFGWNHSFKNIPAAYLAGMLAGKTALAANIQKVVPDLGVLSVTKGGKVFAALKGAKDAGLSFNLSSDIVPDDNAIKGARIAPHVKSAATIAEDFEKVRGAVASFSGKSDKK